MKTGRKDRGKRRERERESYGVMSSLRGGVENREYKRRVVDIGREMSERERERNRGING